MNALPSATLTFPQLRLEVEVVFLPYGRRPLYLFRLRGRPVWCGPGGDA